MPAETPHWTGFLASDAAVAAGWSQPITDTLNRTARPKSLTYAKSGTNLQFLMSQLGMSAEDKDYCGDNMFHSSGKVIRTAMFVAAGLGLMSCQTTQPETSQPVTRLAPMQKPSPTPEGAVIHGIRNGNPSATKVVKSDDNIMVYDRGGCISTIDHTRGYFAPEVRWENCNGSSGRVMFHGKSGNIWPLQVGKSEEYSATASSRGTWNATRTCEVERQVRITTHTGAHDTFEVVCRSKWATRTYYMSPKLGRFVKYTRRKSNLNSNFSRIDWELTRVDLP